MRRLGFLEILSILGLLLVAQPSLVYSRSAKEPEQKTGMIAQAGQAETKSPGEAPKQSDNMKKESFKKEAGNIIQDLDKKIVALGKKVKKQGSKVKAEAKESWEDLKAKQKVAKKKLDDLSGAGEEAWDKAKSDANAALEEVRKAYDRAVSRFK